MVHSLIAIPIICVCVFVVGCEDQAIEANQRQVQQNQALIEQTQQEIVRLQGQQDAEPVAPVGTPGTCDKKVEGAATRRGGDAYATGNMHKALGYYQDALTACSGSAQANLNLARTYEAMGDRASAIRYYHAAAKSNDPDSVSAQEASSALSRMGTH